MIIYFSLETRRTATTSLATRIPILIVLYRAPEKSPLTPMYVHGENISRAWSAGRLHQTAFARTNMLRCDDGSGLRPGSMHGAYENKRCLQVHSTSIYYIPIQPRARLAPRPVSMLSQMPDILPRSNLKPLQQDVDLPRQSVKMHPAQY